MSDLRHGLLNDQSQLNLLQSHYYSHYDLKRNTMSANPSSEDESYKIPDWKSQSNKRKTTTAALVLCLNLGIPPPDIQKPSDCPVLESFVDPTTYSDSKKALQAIGKNLQVNYESCEGVSSRIKYKQSLDPSVEDLKRLCTTLRRSSKDERILFHYNGHGVPQPTQSGEIWVFNRGYTQYIPVSLYDLQSWLGAPCIFVIDTCGAGNVIENNKKFIQKRIEDEANQRAESNAPSPVSAYLESIQLGACRSDEILPLNPDLPADLFTCCLTSPIEMSVKWFVLSSPLSRHGYYEVLKNKEGEIIIPGKLTDRRTPLGELNWIFTAITDTIAWTSLSRPLFKRLFRQDLMVAVLFRNFLLAKKIMPLVGCHPISDPPLPDINNHPMWESWELAIDELLSQLVKNKENDKNSHPEQLDIPQLQVPETQTQQNGAPPNSSIMNYQHSSFFEQHLTAFEIWLQYGSSTKEPPQQLPVVLQVLLSQAHRLRALILLSKFLDLGPWAVYLALSIGIFPYIVRLLQSPAPELKPVLTFIWARIMSVDYKNTQQELCKDRGYNYFVSILTMQTRPHFGELSNGNGQMEVNDSNYDEQKAMSAFILAMFVRDYEPGQKLCFSIDLVKTCIFYVETSESPLLRQWSALLICELLKNNMEVIIVFLRSGFTDKLLQIINDPIPEIRASIINCFYNFILLDHDEDLDQNPMRDDLNKQEIKIAIDILDLINDGSPLIRREVTCFFSRFVLKYLQFFLVSAFGQLEEEITLVDNPSMIDEVRRKSPAYGSVFSSVWKALLILSEDPQDEVKDYAEQVVDYILWKLNESALGEVVGKMEDYLLQKRTTSSNIFSSEPPLRPLSTNGMGPKLWNSNGTANGRRVQSLDVNNTRKSAPSQTTRQTSTSSTQSLSDKFFSKLSLNHILKNLGIPESEETDTSSIHKFNLLLQQPASLAYGVEPRPTSPRFHPRPKTNSWPVLPLTSGFFQYSCEYFQEPQIGSSESDEPGSEDYTKGIWRRNRNEAIIAETQPQKELSLTGNWKNLVTTLDNKTQPKLLKFAQFENWLITGDEKDNVTVFDWEKETQLSRFCNGNPFGTKITDLKLLNEDDIPLLLTGSSDGVVKIYKNFQDPSSFQMITGWRALTDTLLTPRSIGLISEWQQSRGSLLVTGDVKIIKIWDAPREKCVSDVPMRSTSLITSLTSDQVAGDIFVGGFQDGSMRVYDRRLDARDSMVKLWKPKDMQSRSLIKNVHMQRGGLRELVSGCSNGLVQLWDIRLNDPIVRFKAFDKTMTTAMIHEHAPFIACASKEVDIYSTTGNLVANISNNRFMNTLNGTARTNFYVNALMLHPHRLMTAANYHQSSVVNIYQCEEQSEH
ncbi:hypothetical protein OGAPHI_004890 [Ogataea philodendri]|uniref:Raptor N-terminal CASPase-like domain-containing protein n=1 Tax=Ogataea philodendri TaxID=1378263 RepID=A0A9P8T3U7_9ASCO|nr:uncharacterized protein OGAPHI_004890 [Ogataea philodendri]KAH3664176.1 hypothetical protein OGAPHI_004890 [Ogataea philodendri]